MWKQLLLLNIFFRLVSPFLIFFNPVIAEAVNWFFDQPDGYFASRSGWDWKRYHRMDKLFDLWWYLFIFIYSFRLSVFPIFLALFVYRLIGQTISIISLREKVLLFFPNVLECYFIAYLMTLVSPGLRLFFYDNQTVVLSVCLLLSFSQEYRIHVQRIYFATLFWKLKIRWNRRK